MSSKAPTIFLKLAAATKSTVDRSVPLLPADIRTLHTPIRRSGRNKPICYCNYVTNDHTMRSPTSPRLDPVGRVLLQLVEYRQRLDLWLAR